MRMTPSQNRRALQVCLGVVAAVPVASGLWGMIAGPAGLPGGQHTTATVDSEYRFTNAFWFAAGLVVCWAIPQVERATVVLRVVLGTAFAGGLARLLAILAGGTPHPVFLGALVIELIGVPLLLVWQSGVTRS
jgi:hypothetical protein